MPSIGGCDTKIWDLIDRYPHWAPYGIRLATCQGVIAGELGHILALNDELVWRKIKGCAPEGILPNVGIRCILCMAVARLTDWLRASTYPAPFRERIVMRAREYKLPGSYLFLEQCPGAEYATRQLDDRKALAGQ